MKKLIVYDYMGNKVYEFDTFLEGMDFTFEALAPTAVWFGKLMLVDKEPEQELGLTFLGGEPTEEEIKEIEQNILDDAALEAKRDAIDAQKEQTELVVEQVIDAQGLPRQRGNFKEVESEPTQPDDTSTGDARASEASQPESLEDAPKNVSRRRATPRIKGRR